MKHSKQMYHMNLTGSLFREVEGTAMKDILRLRLR